MSFKTACFGLKPSAGASPPQKGSTNLPDECDCHSDARCGTSQRFPPAHFKGGFKKESGVALAFVAELASLTAARTLAFLNEAPAMAGRAALARCFACSGSKAVFKLVSTKNSNTDSVGQRCLYSASNDLNKIDPLSVSTSAGIRVMSSAASLGGYCAVAF
jgi:hypothetical protein